MPYDFPLEPPITTLGPSDVHTSARAQTIRKDYGVVTMLCLLRQLWYIILLDLGYHPASHARDMDMGK
jgi:hypothetical protein